MLDSILSANTGSITLEQIAICTGTALALGIVIALAYMVKNQYSKHFVFTIALLPAIIQSVIMIVNGNLGAGVAVMGAFSLVRFRSVPGNAREIASIFFAMAAGLAVGMGYVLYAALFTLVICAAMLAYAFFGFGEKGGMIKQLRVMIPEDTDWTHLFDDLFAQYARHTKLERVRTTNLGSLYELQYTLELKSEEQEKQLLDGIRQRNGNLNISCGWFNLPKDEL